MDPLGPLDSLDSLGHLHSQTHVKQGLAGGQDFYGRLYALTVMQMIQSKIPGLTTVRAWPQRLSRS